MKLSLLLLCILFAVAPARAVKSKCPFNLARDAQTEIDQLKDWNGMYEWFTHYVHCDADELRKRSSARIGWLLTAQWDHVSHFHALAIFDKKFEAFVLNHVDVSLPPNVLHRIADNTVSFCPSRSAQSCLLLGGAAQKALAHSE